MRRVVTAGLSCLALVACGGSGSDQQTTERPAEGGAGAGAGPLPGQVVLPDDEGGAQEDDGQQGGGGADENLPDGGGDTPSTPPTTPETPATPVTATSSATDSLLYALVWRDPSAVGNSFAHDHVVRASDWAGTFTFLPGDASACAVDVDVVTGALINDEPALREAVGLDSAMSERDRTSVRDSMLGDDQLDAANHPMLSFTSLACRGDLDGAGTLEVDGTLTVRGASRPVTWTVEYAVDDAGGMLARGSLTIAQSDFGITPYQAFFGAVKVADEVDLAFELTGTPR
jgi:polyisoprenoid-binding protein YceI